jgi:hypothetical protein
MTFIHNETWQPFYTCETAYSTSSKVWLMVIGLALITQQYRRSGGRLFLQNITKSLPRFMVSIPEDSIFTVTAVRTSNLIVFTSLDTNQATVHKHFRCHHYVWFCYLQWAASDTVVSFLILITGFEILLSYFSLNFRVKMYIFINGGRGVLCLTQWLN